MLMVYYERCYLGRVRPRVHQLYLLQRGEFQGPEMKVYQWLHGTRADA